MRPVCTALAVRRAKAIPDGNLWRFYRYVWPESAILGNNNYSWWVVVLSIRSGDQAAIHGVVFTVVTLSQKIRLTKSRLKTLLIVFFDSKLLIHREFVPVGTTVNAEYYEGVLKQLLLRIRWIRPQYRHGQWNLFHDNARPHTAIRVTQFLDRHQVPVLDHTPFSPDLAPAGFFLFPRFKGVLKGQHFSDITEIQQRVTTVLRAIPKEAFADSFQQLYTRCQKCIAANGEYFEGQ